MPRSQHINRAFTFGYISKNLYGRADQPAYEEGLAECINFIPKPQGSLERRQGREHITAISATDGTSIPFITRSNDAFMAVFTDDDSGLGPGLNSLRMIDKRGVYNNPATPAQEVIESPNLEDGIVIFEHLKVEGLPDGGSTSTTQFIPAYGSIVMKSDGTTAFKQPRVRDYYLDINIPPGAENDNFSFDILFEENPTTTRVEVGTAKGDASIGTYLKDGSGRLAFRINHLSLINDASPGTGLIIGHPYKKGEFNSIQHDFEPEGDAIWLVHEKYEPMRLSFNSNDGTFTLQGAVSDGIIPDPPSDWAPGNYPGSITFHQGRLWFAGTRLNPATLYASQSGEYSNFSAPGNSITPDTPLEFTLSRFGSISWLAANKELIIGTSSGEFRVTSTGSLINAGDVMAVLESTYGSIRSQPILIANRIVFATEDGRRLRDLGYNDSEGSWISIDLTLTADDITLNRTIKDIAYSQNPDHLIRCLMDDGTIIVCSYRKSLQTIGWYEEVTDGSVISLASVLVNGNSETIYLVKRGYQDEISVEWEAPRDTIFLDNYKTQFGDVPTKNVTFPHLRNRFVAIFADNAIQPGIELNAAGEGVIDYEAVNITAGIPYPSILLTLPIDSVTRSQNTTSGFMKRFNKIWVKLNRSAKPLINGERPPTRTPVTPMNLGEPTRFQDVKVANMGWDEFGQISVIQDLPYACIVASIYGEVSEDQL